MEKIDSYKFVCFKHFKKSFKKKKKKFPIYFPPGEVQYVHDSDATMGRHVPNTLH